MHDIKPTKASRINPLPLSRDERIAALLNYIADTIHQPMTPAEFLQKWVKHPLTEKNYRICGCKCPMGLNHFSNNL